MDVDDAADFERRARPERQAGDAPALEADRRLGDARRLDLDRGHRVQFGLFEFADALREIDRADVHAFGERLVDQVDDELAGIADVALGVLPAVAGRIAGADAEHDNGRYRADRVEEAERRGVDMPRQIDRRRERDRPRHDSADQELVGVARREPRQIEMHIPSPPLRRYAPPEQERGQSIMPISRRAILPVHSMSPPVKLR